MTRPSPLAPLRVRCLDLAFELDADHPELLAVLADLFADCISAEAPRMRFSLRGAGPVSVYVDGIGVRTTPSIDVGLAHVVWEINRAVVESCTSLALHAGAVERDGRAVVLTAASGGGKSTTTAALVAAGFAYLTDEAAALDMATGEVRPYPKPIALGAESWALFRPHGGDAAERDDAFAAPRGEYFVTCRALGSRIGVQSRPALVVVPRYRPGAPTEVCELGQAETLVLLGEQSFNFERFGAQAFACLAELVGRCACYRVDYGDARDAAGAISGLVG